MLGAIYTGLSGMNAYSEGLSMISNDVANLNTLGYKGNFLSFNSLFQQGGGFLGSTGGAGYGVSMGSSFVDFSQGTLQQTTNPLDLAIQGNGFLTVLKDGKTYFERTGNFFVDQDGFVSDSAGHHLATLNDSGQTVPFSINEFKTSDPAATANIVFDGNLNVNEDNATVADIKVFDSRGGEHKWTVKFQKSATSLGDWQMTVTDENGAQIGDTQTLQFDAKGNILNDPKFTMTKAVDGADDLSVTLDFSGNITADSSASSTIAASSVDGNAMGTLTGVGVNADGQIELAYSNGKTVDKGFVAIANFQDPQMLQRLSGGLYTDPSNQPVSYHTSGSGGVGTLQSGQVEASNVNLSSEFGQLILIERGFQACSQIVSISNEMIQTLFGMRGQG
jgi:flagellar hook protein FlgE